MNIAENIEKQIKTILKKRQRPRRSVVAWMRRNNIWYQEAIALEWERQTGENWTAMMQRAQS